MISPILRNAMLIAVQVDPPYTEADAAAHSAAFAERLGETLARYQATVRTTYERAMRHRKVFQFLIKKRPMSFKGGRNRQARNVLKLLWRDTYYHKGVRV